MSHTARIIQNQTCPINISCQLKKRIKKQSLTFFEDGTPSESYKSILGRAMDLLEKNSNKIDVGRL